MSLKFEYKSFSIETRDRILHGVITGKLEAEDYELLVPEAERLINEYGRIRIIAELVDFEGWSAGALWEECKLAYHHLKDIERMAVVGDKAWEKGMTAFVKPFVGAKLKYFDASERMDAIDWIQDDIESSKAA
jgi:hypothetical protein